MALQAKRPHIAPQTQHGKRFCIFYELFFRDILLQGRRQLVLETGLNIDELAKIEGYKNCIN